MFKFRYAIAILMAAAPVLAQSITGSIVGSVKDPTGLAIFGAEVTLSQVATGAARRAATNETGDFVFTTLNPGEYSLAISSSGFKRVQKSGLQLSAAETLPAGTFRLEVGGVTETVSVTAEGAAVQTASSERAGLVTTSQIEGLAIRGRNVTSLLQLLPGVVDVQENESLTHNWNINALGNRRNNNNMSLDGISLNDIGNNYNSMVLVSMDSVAEVKVLLSNFQAEYGKFSGANVQMITKSGTKQFHGLGSYFKRHEQFNANNFFNNRLGAANPRYRFNTWSYALGGPVYIPNKFNRNKEKLFFFWSQEYWPLRAPQPIAQRTVPTELEREGDFSQSLELNGRPVSVLDPTTRQPLPGNRVPATLLNKDGQALLKVLPQPNFLNRAVSGGSYNYIYQSELYTPKQSNTLKLDYQIDSTNLVSGTAVIRRDTQTGPTGLPSSGSANWPQMVKTFNTNGYMLGVRYHRILSPTLVNEFIFGHGHRPQDDVYSEDDLARSDREKVGFRVGQFNGDANPLKIIPNATFGGVTNAANLFTEGRFPLTSTLDTLNFAENLSKTAGRHTLKAGFALERVMTDARTGAIFNGAFDFANNSNNPLNTGYAYANAAMGVFSSYTESSGRPYSRRRATTLEWFAQDNWKATRRLTLDLGLRFTWMPPIYDVDNLISGFAPDRYDPSRKVRLIEPRMVDGRRAGVHPVTGQVYAATLIGAIAPGTGDLENGLALPLKDSSLPRSLMKSAGVLVSPRVGFAYDVFGNGKTAIRGGAGLFYNRDAMETMVGAQAPYMDTPVVYFGTLPTLLSSAGQRLPQTILGIDGTGVAPKVINYSISVQQALGFATMLDVGYVGSLGRNLMWQRNLNAIPFGSTFNPANADPTNGRPLANAFLRPYTGYEDINFREWAGSSNYHSMQVQVNRRFAKGLQLGASWTWSKAMDYTDAHNQNVSTLLPVRVWNYGLASFDRTHVLKVNWLYALPKSPWRAAAARAVLDNWQVSGIASFVSGQPMGVGFSTVNALDITGSPTDGARIYVTGNPVLPKGEQTFSQFFRKDVFRVPAVGTVGNAARTLFRGPGVNNWESAIFKNFPIREQMKLQFRCELYNAFNHTQFSTVDNTARFDAQGNQTNSRLGEFTAARNPRFVQFALRFTF